MGFYSDRVCIVTGAASGIGRALSIELARSGARVILTDINSELGRQTAETIAQSHDDVQFVALDVTDLDAFKTVVDDAFMTFGRLDYLFSNAGIAIFGEARDYTDQDWREVIATNLNGPVNGVAATYSRMAQQGFGHIVNIASAAGLIAPTHLASYTASKHGVVGLSMACRIEGADLGVKVSVVCPGFIHTPIYHSRTIKLDQHRMLADAPKGMPPEKCARIILRGVEKNKALILVTLAAKVIYWMNRISPGLCLYLGKWMARDVRRKYRLEDPQRAA
jgi:NAD(P)-dependent dehydrogenase (short-subunit alcohol dehydrogenase family)